MRKLFIIVAFIILPHTAFAGDWVLWQCEVISGAETNPPIPLTEHKTLKACQDASAQVADTTFAWAKKNDTVQTESVKRSMNPNDVLYTYKTGFAANAEYRCYPFGVVPTQERK
jgi:hypothetical protein